MTSLKSSGRILTFLRVLWMQGHRKACENTWRQIEMEERRKLLLHYFKSQVNSKSKKSKRVMKGQSGQKCEESSKVVNFIF